MEENTQKSCWGITLWAVAIAIVATAAFSVVSSNPSTGTAAPVVQSNR